MPRLSLFVLLLALLSGCTAPASPTPSATLAPSEAEGPTLTPSPTVIETPTATEIPRPAGAENLPSGVTLAQNEDGSWGIKIGNEAKAIPGAVFDATGLHMTLDSGRVVDIAASELQKGIVYDQELNLFKIFDNEGIISAEYDPGVGQPNTPDYIPGQGWVDMQNLADKACRSNSSCFVENARGLPAGTTLVIFSSTGIFRKIDAINTQTNESVGKHLLLQFVTQNPAGKPTTGWIFVQTEDLQGGYIFAIYNNQVLRSIEEWQSMMPKGSLKSLGFPKNENLQWWFWTQNHLAPADYHNKVTQFLASKGSLSLDYMYPLMRNSEYLK